MRSKVRRANSQKSSVVFLQIADNPHEKPKAAAAVLSANAAALGSAAFD
jgi:hypothetical protein